MGYPYDGVDLREHPERYRIGRGEQGVFHAEPYRSELLPLWRYRDGEAARGSAAAIWEKYLRYREEGDFVGMDVARKYLQMGWTRSRRYAKYRGGKKSEPREVEDPEKAESAAVFKEYYDRVRKDARYVEMRERHREGEPR